MIAPTCCVLVKAGFTVTALHGIPVILELSVGTPGWISDKVEATLPVLKYDTPVSGFVDASGRI